MPITEIAGLECPCEASPGQAGANVGAVEKVMLVVEANELVSGDRPVAKKCDAGEQEADGGCNR